MKKVTLGHLSRKHNLSIDELRTLFVGEGLMKSGARKVVKKPAKKLIASYLAADTTASGGLFSWLFPQALGYLALGALMLWGLFGFINHSGTNSGDESIDTTHLVQQGIVDHNAADIVKGDTHNSSGNQILPKTGADLSELK